MMAKQASQIKIIGGYEQVVKNYGRGSVDEHKEK